METPDPPNDTPKRALKQVVLTPHDIPWSLRATVINCSNDPQMKVHSSKIRSDDRQSFAADGLQGSPWFLAMFLSVTLLGKKHIHPQGLT